MLEYGIFMAFQPIEISMSLTRFQCNPFKVNVQYSRILASTMYCAGSSFFLAMDMVCVKEAQ